MWININIGWYFISRKRYVRNVNSSSSESKRFRNSADGKCTGNNWSCCSTSTGFEIKRERLNLLEDRMIGDSSRASSWNLIGASRTFSGVRGLSNKLTRAEASPEFRTSVMNSSDLVSHSLSVSSNRNTTRLLFFFLFFELFSRLSASRTQLILRFLSQNSFTLSWFNN